jgi:hypothetical protein
MNVPDAAKGDAALSKQSGACEVPIVVVEA